MQALIRVLLLFLFTLLAPHAAAEAPPRPAADDVRARLETLADRKLPEAEQRAAQQALEQAQASLASADDYRRRLATLKETLATAAARIADARRQYLALQGGAGDAAPPAADTPLAQLEQRLAEREGTLSDWRKRLDEADSLLIGARTGPERAQTEISNGQQRMTAIEAALASGREAGRDARPLTAERRDALAAEWHALDAQVALRRQELAGNSILIDLGLARQELARLQVEHLEAAARTLQDVINQHRATQTERTVQALVDADATPTGDTPIAREAAINQELSQYLLRATEHLSTLTRRNQAVSQQLDALNRSTTVIDEQIGVLQGSILLSRILLEQRRALPAPVADASLADQIADIRLYQFEIGKQREQLANPSAYMARVLAEAPAGQAEALREPLAALLATRAELLERLNRDLTTVLNQSITLQLAERQLQVTADRLRATLDERMFWIPSNRPLDLAWLQAVPATLGKQFAAIEWESASRELWDGLQASPFLFLPALLLSVALFSRRRWLRRKLDSLHADIGYVRRDSQLHTPLAILLNLLLALPVSLLLALGGIALQMDARGQNASLGAALTQMAQAWLVFHTAYRILIPGGVAERHFQWPAELVRALHRNLRKLGLVVVAVVAVVAVAERQPESLGADVLGIVILLAGYATMAWLLGSGLLRSRLEGSPSPLRVFLGLALGLMPLALIGALVTGYYYTALKLTGRLVDTLYVLILWCIAEAVLVRALAVAAHRLDYKRAVARREAAEREGRPGADSEPPPETPMLDLARINQQSLRLLHLALLSSLAVALYWVWADLLTVVSYLDNITLYEYISGSGDASAAVPISLADLLGALVIAAIAFMLATNLPGLLQVLVLSRLQLAQGSAYAITTLLSYVIVGAGIAATLSTLGVSWDKLQWLVAALSVGLGFGLQEIFANFVSGLIILFERPLRIGDVVTIGNVSGTVSRIQIRATTITDFDRKEMIVPNKAFITGQLTNWSLTDTVTRVTIKLGVAYGSDLELTRRLLLEIAADNARVLKDPEPLVFFLNFGSSTLDHELRVHVRELADRNAAIDEIDREIDRRFRAAGIEIASSRMDVYIRSIADGREAKLQSIEPPGAAP